MKKLNSVCVLCSFLFAFALAGSGAYATNVPTDVLEQQRVLLSFSQQGHVVEQIFKVSSRVSPAMQRLLQARQRDAMRNSVTTNLAGAYIVWFDAAGVLLTTEPLQDPRTAHVPLDSAKQARPEYFVRESGAYLLTGPAYATTLQVVLPALRMGRHYLPAETLKFNLTE